MSLSSSEVWKTIVTERLVSQDACRVWAAEVAQSMPSADSANGLKVLLKLIDLGRLTKYQAKVLAGQSSQPLRIGNWLLRQPLKSPVWSDWFEARDTRLDPTSEAPEIASTNPILSWVRALRSEELESLRPTAPGMDRASKLSHIQCPRVQTVQTPEWIDGSLLVAVAPVKGQLLYEQFASQRCTVEQSLVVVSQVATALTALHNGGVVHGRILPDRIYWYGESITLAIDPLCSFTVPVSEAVLDKNTAGVLGTPWQSWQALQFIAPEFQAPAQIPNYATDVFSLGCLWWWLLTGNAPIRGDSTGDHSVGSILGQQASELPQLPAECKLPEPWLRCLQHCLGRNLDSRFGSAIELSRALEAAVTVVQAGPGQAPIATTSVPAPVPVRGPETKTTSPKPSTALVNAAPLTVAGQPEPVYQSSKLKHAVRRKRSNRWLLPAVGGSMGVIALLVVIKFSGILQPAAAPKKNIDPPAAYVPKTNDEPSSSDPRLANFQIVSSGRNVLWAPPEKTFALPITLLPPGGQLFLSVRPASLMASSSGREILAALDHQLSSSLAALASFSGLALEQIDQATLGFYSPATSGQSPQICVRFTLVRPVNLGELRQSWHKPIEQPAFGQTLLVSSDQRAYYVAQQPLVHAQSVSEFSVGPTELMQGTAEAMGAAGLLVSPMERLLTKSDRQAHLSLVLAPAYLFTEGRELLIHFPPKLANRLKELIGNDTRAVALDMRLEPTWYLEAKLIEANDLEAGKTLEVLKQEIAGLPNQVETWLVKTSPHPYWRALALRFPQMLRSFSDYTRYGIENGVAMANTYLPSEAASNLILASWIALQDTASDAMDTSQAFASASLARPWAIDEYLDRQISVAFDQEPIEVALQLVCDEANDKLPPGTPALRFLLDGGAFEKSGITRNQQLRNFQFEKLPVRAVLTEIAKRGNPVTTVTDTIQIEQKLVWVVADDPQEAGVKIIALTTRAAATSAGTPLPREFASQ